MALTNSQLKALKKQVLKDQVQMLSDDMGSPERYFPELRSAGLLDKTDCERIKSLVTTKEKVLEFVDVLSEGRQGRDGSPPFDVLVEVLNRGEMHSEVARGLQRALEKAKEEEIRQIGKFILDCSCKGISYVQYYWESAV